MTANQFRKLALSLPDAVEAEHMDHPDFRVGGKIFGTLGPGEKWGGGEIDAGPATGIYEGQARNI